MPFQNSLACAIDLLNLTSPQHTDSFLIFQTSDGYNWDPTVGLTRDEVAAIALQHATGNKLLICVNGGVADYAVSNGCPVSVLLVDCDNDPKATVPSDWEELGRVFNIPVTPPKRPAEDILKDIKSVGYLTPELSREVLLWGWVEDKS